MGNSASIRYEAVQSLKRELQGLNQQLASAQNVQRREIIALESKLQQISAERLNTGFFPRNILKGGVQRFGASLITDEDVHVRVGPVIGKVTDTTAIILLEIDRARDIECHISLCDDVAPQGRVVATVRQSMPANAPRVFHVTGLSVNQRYRICFSGVSRRDAEERVGQFKTFDTLSNRLRAVVVSGERSEALNSGDPNVWEKVAARVASFEVDVMIHLGGQVHSTQAFKDAMIIFQRHEQTGFVTTGQHEIEETTRERLRDVYRRAWNLPRTRQVLASCSHLMIWNDEDIYHDFTIARNSLGDPISSDMIRMGHEVYREYQRQLWDPDCVDVGPSMYGASQANRRSQALLDAVRKRLLDKVAAEGAAVTKEKDGFSDDEDDAAIENIDPCAQEHHYHRLGGVGILFVDMRGGRLLERGGQALDNPIVSHEQWTFMERALSDPDGGSVRVLLVCVERPLVEETPSSARIRSRRPETFSVKERWAYNDQELSRLLNMLVAWRRGGAHRVVQILTGGLRVGVETLIRQKGTNEILRQLSLGPITDDVVSKLTVPLDGNVDEKGTFTYVHSRMARPQRNYAMLDIGVPFLEQEPPSLSLRLVGAVEQPPRALLGPIVGRVTSTTAVIMLEVEMPAVITCILTDLLTRKTYKFVNTMPGRRPKAFVASGLLPERRYAIHFNGIARWNQHRGAVTTTPDDDHVTAMSIAFVQSDRPNRLGAKDMNPWHMLHEQLEYPWGGPDVVVHLGGQVDPSQCFDEVLALLRRDGAEKGMLEEAAKERIRSVYRFAWSLPHTKEVLARTSNLMIWSDVDLAEGFDQPDGGPGLGSESASWGPTLLRLTRSVFREYQRQLWEPSESGDGGGGAQPSSNWSPLEGRGGVSERVFIRWGPVGIALLDTFGSRLGASGHVLHEVPSLLSDQHWRDLAAMMADDTLRSLIIASPTVMLDDSPDDAVLKALHPSKSGRIKNGWPYNRHDLKRMLKSLFAWKKQSTVEVNSVEMEVRDVLVVSGGSRFGMTTTISSNSNNKESGTGTRFRQIVLPPITDTPSPPGCELKGHIDEENTMSYSHGTAPFGRGFGIVKIGINIGDCEGGRGIVDGDVYVADDTHSAFELGQKLMR